MPAELTVGEFSRMTHLSVKTLRHYHQVGLLEPAQVNPETGYRYYSADQVPQAQVIRRLRDLEMPVGEVKAVLAAPDVSIRNAVISAHLDRLETELGKIHTAVDSLRSILDTPESAVAIEHRTTGPMAALGVAEMVDRDDVLTWWQGALGELRGVVRAQGLEVTGPRGGLFASELFQHGRGQATVFIPIEREARPIGRVTPFVVPAAELAVLTDRGSLEDIDISYGQLGSYVTTHEISIEGPLREYYLVDADDVADPHQWVTEICWPIFRSDDNP
jgi:DNA-binding transcriptional MerR regulator/effector-binding domain-containing protein